MTGMLLIVLAVVLQKAPTLANELLQRDLPPPAEAAELDRPIASYSVFDDDSRFVIAYYSAEPDDLLHELRVRTFDKRSRAWRSATFTEDIGSVLEIRAHGGHLYVVGHLSPSASPSLVLQHDLSLKRVLDGWPVLMLGDGRVAVEAKHGALRASARGSPWRSTIRGPIARVRYIHRPRSTTSEASRECPIPPTSGQSDASPG